MGVGGDQPRQLEAPALGPDGRRQVERQVTWLERRLALIEIAQGAHLRQQQAATARMADEGFGQAPHCSPVGQQHEGVRQGFRP